MTYTWVQEIINKDFKWSLNNDTINSNIKIVYKLFKISQMKKGKKNER